jgi:hypothetical protein
MEIKMKSSKGWQGFAILGLIVGGLYFVSSRKKTSTPERSNGRTEAVGTKAMPKQEIIARSDVESAKTASSTVARHKYNAMVKSGVREIPTNLVGPDLKFSFRMVTVPIWCNIGDFDFMKGIVDNITKPHFLMTIEPLKGDKSKIIKRRLSLYDIKSAKIQEGLLLAQQEARDYGVYLCFDPGNTNECSDKELMDSREWGKAISDPSKVNSKILYFQLITVREKRAFLIPGHKWDEATMDKLSKDLKPIIESESSLDKMKKNLNALQSVPGRITKRILEFPLPFKDPAC